MTIISLHPRSGGTGPRQVFAPRGVLSVVGYFQSQLRSARPTRQGWLSEVPAHRREVSHEHQGTDNVRHVIESAGDSTQLRGARENSPWAIQLTCRRKPKGTTACWKRRDVPKARTGGCGKARVIRRRLHCLNFRFQRWNQHIPRNRAWRGHRLTADFAVVPGTLGRWAEANEASQGTERSAYVALFQLRFENMGSPSGRESYGDGALVVVRGRESRPHGEGGQVSKDCQHARGARDA